MYASRFGKKRGSFREAQDEVIKALSSRLEKLREKVPETWEIKATSAAQGRFQETS